MTLAVAEGQTVKLEAICVEEIRKCCAIKTSREQDNGAAWQCVAVHPFPPFRALRISRVSSMLGSGSGGEDATLGSQRCSVGCSGHGPSGLERSTAGHTPPRVERCCLTCCTRARDDAAACEPRADSCACARGGAGRCAGYRSRSRCCRAFSPTADLHDHAEPSTHAFGGDGRLVSQLGVPVGSSVWSWCGARLGIAPGARSGDRRCAALSSSPHRHASGAVGISTRAWSWSSGMVAIWPATKRTVVSV